MELSVYSEEVSRSMNGGTSALKAGEKLRKGRIGQSKSGSCLLLREDEFRQEKKIVTYLAYNYVPLRSYVNTIEVKVAQITNDLRGGMVGFLILKWNNWQLASTLINVNAGSKDNSSFKKFSGKVSLEEGETI